jgi:hypothetical protein
MNVYVLLFIRLTEFSRKKLYRKLGGRKLPATVVILPQNVFANQYDFEKEPP